MDKDYAKAVEGARQWVFLLKQANAMGLAEMLSETVNSAAGYDAAVQAKKSELAKYQVQVEAKMAELAKAEGLVSDLKVLSDQYQTQANEYNRKLDEARKAYEEFLGKLPK